MQADTQDKIFILTVKPFWVELVLLFFSIKKIHGYNEEDKRIQLVNALCHYEFQFNPNIFERYRMADSGCMGCFVIL